MKKQTPSSKEEMHALLYEASKLLGAPPNLKPALESLITGVLHRYHLSMCLLLTDSGSGILTSEFSMGVSEAFAQGLRVPKGEGLLGVVYASGHPRKLDGPDEAKQDVSVGPLFQRQRLLSALLIPLKAEGRLVGTAFFGSQTEKTYSEDTLGELTDLSDHLALALHNGRRVAALETSHHHLETQVASTVEELSRTESRLVQKVRELKTVYELALETAASTRVDDIIRIMITGIKELIGVQSAAFFLLQGAGDTLEPLLPAFDLPPAEARALVCRPEQSPWLAAILQTKEPQFLNLLDSSESLPPSWKSIGIRSLLALPLLQAGEVKGVFCVINKVNGLFNGDDVRLLALLTGRVTDVLHRIGLDQELRQRVHDLSVLQDISSQLPNPPILSDTLGAIGRVARRALGSCDVCLFFLYHAESEALVLAGGDWDSKITLDPRAFTIGVSEKVPLADVFQEGRPAHYERGASPESWDKEELVRALGINQLLYLPLDVEQGRIGVFAIGMLPPRVLSLEDRRLAGLVSKQVAIVVERSRLYERLKSANDKLEQINHLKNEFISMVSHELRTPLTTIKGFVTIVLNEETGPLNDQQRHFLQTSDRAIDRLTLLVSDLLDISRIEAGQIKMQQRPVSVKDICQRVATNFGPQLKAQNLTLTLQIPDPLPLIMADPDRIGQVFDNLLSNALKYTSKGGITVSATDKGDFIMISVKDTGSGIPQEEHDKIFDKFYQIKVGGGYPSKGTGLGLAIVKSIVESHRGKIWVEPATGQGAEFRFILPRARTEALEDSPL